MFLSRSQQRLLKSIHSHDGQWNWYQLVRSCLEDLDSPGDFELGPLFELGLIEARKIGDEPLERLSVTDKGREASASQDRNERQVE